MLSGLIRRKYKYLVILATKNTAFRVTKKQCSYGARYLKHVVSSQKLLKLVRPKMATRLACKVGESFSMMAKKTGGVVTGMKKIHQLVTRVAQTVKCFMILVR